MKRLVLILVATMLVMGLAGCEKSDRPDKAVPYDQDLDGVLPLTVIDPVESTPMTAQPTGGAGTRSGSSTGGPGLAPPAGLNEPDQIKQIAIAINQASDGEAMAAVLQYFPAGSAQRQAMQAMVDVSDHMDRTAALVRSKLGASYADQLKGEMDKGHPGQNTPDYQVKKNNDGTYSVSENGMEVMAFNQIGGRWQVIPERDTGGMLLALLGAMAPALDSGLDMLDAGLNDGSITAANFDQKLQEIEDEVSKSMSESFDGSSSPEPMVEPAPVPSDGLDSNDGGTIDW